MLAASLYVVITIALGIGIVAAFFAVRQYFPEKLAVLRRGADFITSKVLVPVDNGFVRIAPLFGSPNVNDSKATTASDAGSFTGMYVHFCAVYLGFYVAAVLLALIPLPLVSFLILLAAIIGVVAIWRAWDHDEQRRTRIIQGFDNGSPDAVPDLRWLALLAAVQLIILVPLTLWQGHSLFGVCSSDTAFPFHFWLYLSFDVVCRPFVDAAEVYGIALSDPDSLTVWGKVLLGVKYLLFTFILVQGIARVISIHGLLEEAANSAHRDAFYISKFGRRAVRYVVDRLGTMESENKRQLRKVVEQLASLGVAAIPDLTRILLDGSQPMEARREAAKQMTTIGDDSCRDALIKATTDKNYQVREKALIALAGNAGGTKDKQLVDAVINGLEDKRSSQVRWRAAKLLRDLAIPSSCIHGVSAALLSRVEDDDDEHVRAASVSALATINADVATDILALCDDHASQVRAAAAAALSKVHLTPEQRTEAVERLIYMLADKLTKVRKNAAESLGNLGAADAIGPLQALRETELDSDVWEAITTALEKLERGQED